MRGRWHFKPLIIFPMLLLSLFVCQSSFGQVETGRVVGTIRDSSGASVAGATITVAETRTAAEHRIVTGPDGTYSATDLNPGTYTVRVEHQGFKTAVQSPFKLDVNQVVRVDITLDIGAITQQVEVTAAEPLVETQTSSIGQVIDGERVNALPLNGRNFVQLAYLTPGVNAGPAGIVQQGSIPENERGNGAIQANGLTATNNNFLLNGFDNNEQQIGFEVIQPSVDAIEEFKVQTNSFGADIGRGGAVVNLVLKSGTNQFHGNLFEFLRNSFFDAKNYFDSPTLPIPPYKQNQFGGTFGGPIIRNRAFFFVDYQGTRIRQSQTDISTVPGLGERNGDFSDLLTGVIDPVTGYDTGQIYNPLTYDANTGLRQPFPGNIIPATNLDSAALNVVSLYPAPNLPGSVNNFLYNPVLSNNQDAFDVRVDDQLGSKDSLFATFSFGNVDSHRPDPLPGLAGGGSFSGNVTNQALAAGLSEVHSFAPNQVNELKLGYSRYVVQALPNFAGQPISQQMGIPGVFNPANPIGTGGLVNISISGLAPLGTTDWFPEYLRENNYQLIDSFSWTHDKHSLKFGVDLKRREHGFYQTQNERGDYVFDQQFTENLTDSTGGSPLASFLLGYPISAYRDGQQGTFGMRWYELSGYAMDDYRITPRLTLNLGLRYDVFTPMVEEHNRIANFDFATGQFVSPQTPGYGRSSGVDTDLNNFGPRLGFAWTPGDGRTVFRGGFGIFYDQQADQNDAELAYNPTGLFFSQNVNNAPTTPTISLSTGLPTPTYPNLSDPSGRASAQAFNSRTTYIEEWNFNIERSLAKDSILQVAYVGTRGVKLASLSNQNQPFAPLDSNFGPAPNYGRPYFNTVPNIGPIRTLNNYYNSISNALQVKFEKRFSGNWSMLNAYTWQHTIGQTEENEYLEPQNTHDLAAERGNNGPDYRHQFTSAWSYSLPFGPGQRFLTSSGPLHWITGGWQLNGIIAL
ncbi:MAG: TonB-dependent receptor, partial [Acidobacteriaceae bacterium]|nr:TonB-dependent receptor [Acidobacteriaceae bacterium]